MKSCHYYSDAVMTHHFTPLSFTLYSIIIKRLDLLALLGLVQASPYHQLAGHQIMAITVLLYVGSIISASKRKKHLTTLVKGLYLNTIKYGVK